MGMPNSKRRKRPQTPKARNLATRDMMLYAAQRGQAPTDKAAKAYKRRPKHKGTTYQED